MLSFVLLNNFPFNLLCVWIFKGIHLEGTGFKAIELEVTDFKGIDTGGTGFKGIDSTIRQCSHKGVNDLEPADCGCDR